MSDRAYYPAGAYDDPRAPYNEVENPALKFDVAVSNSLSRETSVWSKNYTQDPDDSEDCPSLENPYTEYEESYTSLLDIINFAKKAAAYMVKTGNYEVESASTLFNIIDSCYGWNVDEEVVQQI